LLKFFNNFFSWITRKSGKNEIIIKYSYVMGHKKMKWKYFTDKEVDGLSDDICFKLDRARELYGYPIVITSGKRDFEKNASVGGVKDSEHVIGEGVDIKAPMDGELRERLAWALGLAGFRRVGSYLRHFHAGNSRNHPNPVFWIGEYKKEN